MKRTIKLQLGKGYLFEETFDTDNTVLVKEVMGRYFNLFQRYRDTHSISNRRWRFPLVMFKDEDGKFYPKYKITPNGSWDEVEQTD